MMKPYTMPKSADGATRQYNAIMRRARRAMSGGLRFGMDWPTFAATFPEEFAHIQAMRAAFPVVAF
jgi:hypothetical protein